MWKGGSDGVRRLWSLDLFQLLQGMLWQITVWILL